MLRLENIEKGIDESWLLFCLTVFLSGALTIFSWQATYIFQIQLSLASNISIGVKSGLYADSEAANVHLASNPAWLKSQRTMMAVVIGSGGLWENKSCYKYVWRPQLPR